MADIEVLNPFHVTADYLGQPGDRTFYVQVEDDHGRLSVLAEKQQVQAIGEALVELLQKINEAPAVDWSRKSMGLREPLGVLWRLGSVGLGVQDDGQRFVVDLLEMIGEDDAEREPQSVRVQLTRDQVRRLAAHALEVVKQGRPRCPRCSRPMGLDGAHTCPATNGHGRLSR